MIDPHTLLADEIRLHRQGHRTMSAAMLAWFLTTVWRLEPEEVEDAVCDGAGDKGLDALVVDDDLAEITIFQGKWRENPTKTQGDNDLRNLVGAAEYFKSPATIDGLLASKPNPELRKLIVRQEVREKIANGSHLVRLVFVTNADMDSAATGYIASRAGQEPALDAWDQARIAEWRSVPDAPTSARRPCVSRPWPRRQWFS